MEKTMNFAELQELREQFKILNDKLEKQAIINDNLIQESIKNKLSYVDKQYRYRFISNILVVPVLMLFATIETRISIEFILFIGVFALLGLILDILCYRKLFLPQKTMMDVVSAVENVTKFRKLRNITNRVMWILGAIAFVWAIGIISNFELDEVRLVTGSFWIIVTIYIEVRRNKKLNMTLDEILNKIKELRSE